MKSESSRWNFCAGRPRLIPGLRDSETADACDLGQIGNLRPIGNRPLEARVSAEERRLPIAAQDAILDAILPHTRGCAAPNCWICLAETGVLNPDQFALVFAAVLRWLGQGVA